MRRVQLALMGAAALAWHEGGGNRNRRNPADPYMTTLAYFNSLREPGGGLSHPGRGGQHDRRALRRAAADP